MGNIHWKSKEEIEQEKAAQPKPLTEQVETLKAELIQAQDTTIMALDVAASLYEELLTIKMQLEGGN